MAISLIFLNHLLEYLVIRADTFVQETPCSFLRPAFFIFFNDLVLIGDTFLKSGFSDYLTHNGSQVCFKLVLMLLKRLKNFPQILARQQTAHIVPDMIFFILRAVTGLPFIICVDHLFQVVGNWVFSNRSASRLHDGGRVLTGDHFGDWSQSDCSFTIS